MNINNKPKILEDYSSNIILKKPKLPRQKPVNLLIILLLLITFIFGVFFGLANSQTILSYIFVNQGGKVINQEEAYKYKQVDFKELFQVWDIIKNNYLNKNQVTDSELFYGALAGSVASLNDPYSIFLSPDLAKEFNQELEGSFYGIGIEVGIKKNILTVISALPGSPAEKAGVRTNDQIVAINNQETINMGVDYAVNLIRGQSGTTVDLLIKRADVNELLKFTIVRAKISIESVKWRMLDNKIAYLQLTDFNQDTADKFKQAINKILVENPRGLILDLRYNPGGYLDTAIDIASFWVEEGVIVKEDYGDPAKNNEYNARGNAKLKSLKTVVLINGGSASAAEIVAGALQDYQLATLVGEKTFGKGTIQDLTQLDDGSAIKLTIARWLTPKGKSIEENGITPDVEVVLTLDDYDNNLDPQLTKAIELLNQ